MSKPYTTPWQAGLWMLASARALSPRTRLQPLLRARRRPFAYFGLARI
jgi:hypothetical protein